MHDFGECLLGIEVFEHAVDALIRRIAACLGILCSFESVVGRALSTLSELPSFIGHALCIVRCGLSALGDLTHGVEVFN